MYGNCDSDSNYLETGRGVLYFQFTNLRADVRFYFFTGGYNNTIFLADATPPGNYRARPKTQSIETVTFTHINEPLRNRIVQTGNPYVFRLLWDSFTSGRPIMKYGRKSGMYTHTGEC